MAEPDISFVVIGYNESESLPSCLESLARIELPDGVTGEIIYVDGGSDDGSVSIARERAVDRVLTSEGPRRAPENRNAGLRAARGRYIQFVDGDMVMAPDWPVAAAEFLDGHPDTAAVCGNLLEQRTGTLSRAFEIDWKPREGEIRHCGGAAMFRRAPLEHFSGFPEDVAYGEEPYLCWRIRNELNMNIYQLDRTMAHHDLGHTRPIDYWRRNLRVGATYAEIASRCFRSQDRLWAREAALTGLWAAAIVGAVIAFVIGEGWLKAVVAAGFLILLGRKTVQSLAQGYSVPVSVAYALHTYFVKLPQALGGLRWVLRSAFRRRDEAHT